MDKTGICKESKDGIECCVNHYLKGNSCEECSVGWFGWNCVNSCPSGSYGWLCSNRCECPDQLCNFVSGCPTDNKVTLTLDSNSSTSTSARNNTKDVLETSSKGSSDPAVFRSSKSPDLSSLSSSFSSLLPTSSSTLQLTSTTSTVLKSTVTMRKISNSENGTTDIAVILVPIGIAIVFLLITIILMIAWKLNLVQRHNQVLTSEVITLKNVTQSSEETADYQEINLGPRPERSSEQFKVKGDQQHYHTILEQHLSQSSPSKYQEINRIEEEKISEHFSTENEQNSSSAYLISTSTKPAHAYIDVIETSQEDIEAKSKASLLTEEYDDTLCHTDNEFKSAENMYLDAIYI
ncbi:uncharacterized protein LOC134230487 [Saccostrea cucullata]|uniref:uncharacterized protein LOC134230487 n=1 Tax=Saccostrea cuccullata TaxID=36930 RepID=UPI002ED2B79D